MSEWEKVDTFEPIPVNVAKQPMNMMSNEDQEEWMPVESFETPVSNQPDQESWPEWGLRTATRLGSRATEAAIGAPRGIADLAEMGFNMLPNLISEPTKKEIYPGFAETFDTAKSVLPSGEQVQKAIASVLPEGYTEPRGGWEDFTDDLAHEIPFLAAAAITGGLPALAWGAGKALASSVAGQGVKALGGGPGAQFVARLGSSLGTDIFKHKMSGKNIQKFARAENTKRYNEAAAPAQNIHFEGDNLLQNVTPISTRAKSISSKLSPGAQNRVKREAREVESLVQKSEKGKWVVNKEGTSGKKVRGKLNPHEGEVNLKEAIDKKQHLNARIDELSTTPMSIKKNKKEIDYYKQLVGTINEEIKPMESLHPEFGVPYRKAENTATLLGEIKEMQDTIKEAYEDLGKIPGIGKHVRALGKDIKWIFQREPTSAMYKFITKDPETFYKYTGSLINDALVGDKGGVLRNFELINRMMTGK